MTSPTPAEIALFSVKETVRYLGTSRTTLHRLKVEGKLAPVKLGRRSLYRKADVDAFAASLGQKLAA